MFNIVDYIGQSRCISPISEQLQISLIIVLIQSQHKLYMFQKWWTFPLFYKTDLSYYDIVRMLALIFFVWLKFGKFILKLLNNQPIVTIISLLDLTCPYLRKLSIICRTFFVSLTWCLTADCFLDINLSLMEHHRITWKCFHSFFAFKHLLYFSHTILSCITVIFHLMRGILTPKQFHVIIIFSSELIFHQICNQYHFALRTNIIYWTYCHHLFLYCFNILWTFISTCIISKTFLKTHSYFSLLTPY